MAHGNSSFSAGLLLVLTGSLSCYIDIFLVTSVAMIWDPH